MTDPASRVETYRAARERVLARIEEACARAGRSSAEVSLVAVSKTVASDALRDAVSAGLDRLGENRVQEGVAKAPEVPGAHWELVGPLQSNKARRALEVFDSIQTVDSVDLARRLDRLVPRASGRVPGTRSSSRSMSTTTRPRRGSPWPTWTPRSTTCSSCHTW